MRPWRSGAAGMGGGRLCAALSQSPGWGAPGAGNRGSLCLSPSLCLPWPGTNAGFIGVAQCMEGVLSILLRFVSVRCRSDAVCGVPLCAGAGLQACRGHCRSGWVTVRRRAACGPSARVQGPSSGKGASTGPAGGVQGQPPLGRPPAFSGVGGGEGRVGGGRQSSPSPPFGPLVHFPGGCGGWLEGPGPDSPYGRRCCAARPPLQRARPGLFGVSGCSARPGGFAAGWSVSAVTPSHVPCARPGGGSVCRPSLGAWLGVFGARGAGNRSASVRPSAFLGRAPERASRALLRPWRFRSPYCPG